MKAILLGSGVEWQMAKHVVNDIEGIFTLTVTSKTKSSSLWKPRKSGLCLQINGAFMSQGIPFHEYFWSTRVDSMGV